MQEDSAASWQPLLLGNNNGKATTLKVHSKQSTNGVKSH